jgi:hypothetical protein
MTRLRLILLPGREFQGRVLKLVSGYMMLESGALLLIAPRWLANAAAVGVLAASFSSHA